MQSFIINIPEEKVDFFLELAEMLDFEVLEIEEDDFEIEDEPESSEQDTRSSTTKPSGARQAPAQPDDPFLDWEAERKSAKKNKY